MKKILFSIFTLALATMVGCQKSDIDDTQNNPTNSESKITVTANIVSDGLTRVALTPETDGEGKPVVKIDWRTRGEKETFDVYGIEEDPIKVYGPNTFTQSEGSLFSGNNPYQHSWYYYATYPASLITVQKVADEVSIIFDKSNFTSQNGKLSEERTLMWASVSNLDENTKFNFEHLTSLLMPKFRVQGATENLSPANIASITFKSMLVSGETADFEIDCSELGAEDDIYVYLPQNSAKDKNKIEIVVTTNDEKVYDGEIDLEGRPLLTGKLYTANVWLTEKISSNVITYTTTDNQQIVLDPMTWRADNYLSHTFENGIGEITLKDGITAIPYFGFQNLSTLKTVIIPTQVTSISEYAFRKCTGLIEVIMPSVTTVGEHAFNMEGITANNNLQTVDLSNVRVFGEKAFYECHISSANLSSATEIGEKAFAITKLTSITMPKQDCTLGNYGFARIPIQEIDLSAFTSIGGQALDVCTNLKTVIINRETPPAFGTAYGNKDVFSECNALENIYVPDDNIADYIAIDNLSMHIGKIKRISEM